MTDKADNILMNDLRDWFEAQSGGPETGPDWLAPRRRAAMDRFEDLGLPTRKLEDWKYTPLKGLADGGFTPARAAGASDSLAEMAAACLPDMDGPRLVFANGVFDASLSRLDDLPKGVTLLPLTRALEEKAELLRPILGADTGDADSLRALNAALLTDGFLFHVDEDATLEAPLAVLHLCDEAAAGTAAQLRHIVVLDDNAQASLVEVFAGSGDQPSWANIVRDVRCGPNARLKTATLVDEGPGAIHTGHMDVSLARESRFSQTGLLIGGRTARHELRIAVEGEGAEADLAGAYLGAEGQSFTVFTELDHKVPHCRSSQVYRGVLDAGAQAAFQGRVIVREGAQKTDASQSNHNLLLDRSAEADTKPELEIYADDVKCAHGATVGELDADQLFYLESRGLDPELARTMLVEAFVGEIVEKIPNLPLRERVGDLVAQWMKRQGPAKGGVSNR